MTGEVIIIFLAVAFVWAVLGPVDRRPVVQPETRKKIRHNYEEGEGPPNVVNHTPKRKPKKELPPEEERTEALDTFTRMMGKEKKNNVRFE